MNSLDDFDNVYVYLCDSGYVFDGPSRSCRNWQYERCRGKLSICASFVLDDRSRVTRDAVNSNIEIEVTIDVFAPHELDFDPQPYTRTTIELFVYFLREAQ